MIPAGRADEIVRTSDLRHGNIQCILDFDVIPFRNCQAMEIQRAPTSDNRFRQPEIFVNARKPVATCALVKFGITVFCNCVPSASQNVFSSHHAV